MKYFLIFSLIFLPGCDIFSESIIDCFDNDGPEIDLSSLPVATLNEEYYVKITSYITNEPNDSSFNYEFNLDGKLPSGLTYRAPDGDRRFIISGTPTEHGEFSLELHVEVSLPGTGDYLYDNSTQNDGLCYHHNSESYLLIVKY